MLNFGAIVKKYREKSNLTQKDLSDRLDVTSTYLSAVENGRKEPSLSLLKNICKALNISEEIMFWESIEIQGDFAKDEKKAIEIAKVIVRTYYENMNPTGART